MKNITLALTFVSILSMYACTDKKNEIVNNTDSAIEDINTDATNRMEEEQNLIEAAKIADDIPQFSSEENQKFAEEYAQYFNEIMTASSNNETEQLHKLMNEGVEWSKKVQNQIKKMTAEDQQKWTEWSSKLRSAAAGE